VDEDLFFQKQTPGSIIGAENGFVEVLNSSIRFRLRNANCDITPGAFVVPFKIVIARAFLLLGNDHSASISVLSELCAFR